MSPRNIIDLENEIKRLQKEVSHLSDQVAAGKIKYRNKIDTLTNILPIGLFVLQSKDIIFANSAYYDLETKLGKQNIGPSLIGTCRILNSREKKTDINSISKEISFPLPDKSPCWIKIFMADTVLEDKSTCVGLVEEITAMKLAEEKHSRVQQQLQHSQKMESIGTLAGGVAHDFNNILMVILGHVESVKRRMDPEDKYYKELTIVSEAGNRAASLTKKLLAFSRKQIFNPEVLYINSLIKYQVQMIKRLIGEDIQLRTKLLKTIPNVNADPIQIEQILMNLVLNAKDAIEENQENNKKLIEISTSVVNRKDYHILTDKNFEKYIEISISDTGTGMDKSLLEKIFEPFFTTKEVGKGSGLGLSMVYGIIKQNNGEITVDSKVGSGSTFRIFWPIFAEDSKQMEEIVSYNGPPIRGQEHILLVEDDKSVRQFLREALMELGYTIYFAQNGLIAVEIFKEYAKKIHLIITDLIMPEMNGKELADKVRAINPDVNILFTSGYPEEQISAKGALEPGTPYLQKPFTISKLSKSIRDMLDN